MEDGISKKEHWMVCKWRPLCAIVYLIICVWDFIIAPIAFAWIQYNIGGNTIAQWQPLTLMGAGLLHIAFGGILGVSAFTRGMEKRDNNYREYRNSRYRNDDRDYVDNYRGRYQHPYDEN